MRLERASAPECPKCGCNATSLVRAGESFGRAWARFKCDFCAAEFAIGRPPLDDAPLEGVPYVSVRCPKCDSNDCPVTSTRKPRRFHKCRGCGLNFLSVES